MRKVRCFYESDSRVEIDTKVELLEDRTLLVVCGVHLHKLHHRRRKLTPGMMTSSLVIAHMWWLHIDGVFTFPGSANPKLCTLSATTFSVRPPSCCKKNDRYKKKFKKKKWPLAKNNDTMRARVFSLLLACAANFALPWPNRAMYS